MASLTNNDVDRTEWADFSVPSNSMKLNHIVDKPEQSDILTPPILTLPLEHYKMISEKVFISYLRSYRKLYAGGGGGGGEVSIAKVCTLGNRLRAFLTVVIPSHTDYGSSDHIEVTKRINDIARQLEDYCRELEGTMSDLEDSERSSGEDELDLDGCVGQSPNFLTQSAGANASFSNQNSMPSEALSCCSRESTIFGDLTSESDATCGAKELDCKSMLKLSESDEQTFCSSEGSAFGSTSMMVEDFDDNQFKVIQSSSNVRIEDEHSVSFSECSGFDNSVAWETSSISVRGQIGSCYHSTQSESDSAAEIAEFGCEGNWNNDTSSCQSIRTDFESLVKHWREKERDSMASRAESNSKN